MLIGMICVYQSSSNGKLINAYNNNLSIKDMRVAHPFSNLLM